MHPMFKKTIAIDIDGTLRDLEKQIDKYLEIDHPDKIDKYRSQKDTIYRSLDNLFESKEEMYTWMFEERVFELFGMADRLHSRVIDDLNIFARTAKEQGYEVVIASVQREQSTTATLHWLAKWGCKVQKIFFFDSMQDKIDAEFDYYVDDCPFVIKQTNSIKIPYKFTEEFDVPSLDIANGKFDDIYYMVEVEKVLKV